MSKKQCLLWLLKFQGYELKKINLWLFIIKCMMIFSLINVSYANGVSSWNQKDIQDYAKFLVNRNYIATKDLPNVKLLTSTKHSTSNVLVSYAENTVSCEVVLGTKFLNNKSIDNEEKSMLDDYVNNLLLNKNQKELTLYALFVLTHELAHCDFGSIEANHGLVFNSSVGSLEENGRVSKRLLERYSLQYLPEYKLLLNEIYSDVYGAAILLHNFYYNKIGQAIEFEKRLGFKQADILNYIKVFTQLRNETDLKIIHYDYTHTTYKGLNLLIKNENLKKIEKIQSVEELRLFAIELSSNAFLETLKEHQFIQKKPYLSLLNTLSDNTKNYIMLSFNKIVNETDYNKDNIIVKLTSDVILKDFSHYMNTGLKIKEIQINEKLMLIGSVVQELKKDPRWLHNLVTAVDKEMELLGNLVNKI